MFGVEAEENTLMVTDGDHSPKNEELFDRVTSRENYDIVILITHLEATNLFPLYYMQRAWNVTRDVQQMQKRGGYTLFHQPRRGFNRWPPS